MPSESGFEQKPNRSRFARWAIWLILPLTLVISISYGRALTAAETAIGPNCRNGVGGWNDLMPGVGTGWLVDFTVAPARFTEPAAEYVPTVRFRPIYNPPNHAFNRTGNYEIFPALGDDRNELGWLVDRYPGRLWLIGNEPDRPDDIFLVNGVPTRFVGQDNLMPDVYARAYHEVYHYIKKRDPTAQIAIGAILQASPGRMQYLDMVWNSYKTQFGKTMPVDVWNMHLYKVPEKEYQSNGDWTNWSAAAVANGTNPAIALDFRDPNNFFGGGSCPQPDILCLYEHLDFNLFKQDIITFRQWMAAHGERNKPLIISEYSILWPYVDEGGGNCFMADEFGNCFTPNRITNFLNATTDYLETASDPALGYPLDNNRLVQRWIWFAANVPNDEFVASSSKLTNNAVTQLTQVGVAYKNHIASQPLFVDWVVEAVSPGAAPIPQGQTTGSGNITVTLRNRGTSQSQSPATITVRDSSNNVLGTAQVPPNIQGCTTQVYNAPVTLTGIPEGITNFTATITSGSGDADTNTANNSGSSFILGGPDYFLWLPYSGR